MTRAVAVSITALTVLATVIIVLFGLSTYLLSNRAVSKVPEPKVQVSKYEVGLPDAQEMLELVNKERAKVGVAPLKLDPRLNQSAQMKSEEMHKYGYIAHISKHDGKQGYEYAIKTMGNACKFVGENITDNTTKGYNTSLQAIYVWMHSPSHKAAELDPKYEYTGFGVAGTKVTQHFCDAS